MRIYPCNNRPGIRKFDNALLKMPMPVNYSKGRLTRKNASACFCTEKIMIHIPELIDTELIDQLSIYTAAYAAIQSSDEKAVEYKAVINVIINELQKRRGTLTMRF